jgi:hypothetical protein
MHKLKHSPCSVKCKLLLPFVFRGENFMYRNKRKNAVFWDVTPCGSYKDQLFEGTCRLHHQGEKNSALGTMLLVTSNWFFPPWWWRRYVPSKCWLLLEPHGGISQKTVFFIVTVVKTPTLTGINGFCKAITLYIRHWVPLLQTCVPPHFIGVAVTLSRSHYT